VKMSRGEEDGTEPDLKGPGPAGPIGSARGFLAWFSMPLDLGVSL
jgi:hypothetical protein